MLHGGKAHGAEYQQTLPIPSTSMNKHTSKMNSTVSQPHLVINEQLVDGAFAVVHAALNFQHHAMSPPLNHRLRLAFCHFNAQAGYVDKDDGDLSHLRVKGATLLDALVHGFGNVTASTGGW